MWAAPQWHELMVAANERRVDAASYLVIVMTDWSVAIPKSWVLTVTVT